MLPAPLLLGLLALTRASPTAVPLECAPGSPEGCWDPQGPPASAENSAPALESVQPKSSVIAEMLPSPQVCDMCLERVHRAQGQLGGDHIGEDIRRALDGACHDLDPAPQSACIALLATHSSELPALLAQGTPQAACQGLGLCPRRRAAQSHSHARPSTTPSPLDEDNHGTFCTTCKKLLEVSASNLESWNTKRDILLAFKGGCSILPLPYRGQCGHFVTQYEPVLIETLMTVMEPLAACKKVGACHGPREPLVGSERCVVGPSFWCSSHENAKLCGAEEHCQRYVWKEEHL